MKRRKRKRFKALDDLSSLATRDKIYLGYKVCLYLRNQKDIPISCASLQELHDIMDALDDAHLNYLRCSEMERAILVVEENRFDLIFEELLQYIDKVADGSKEIYDKAGIESNPVSD